MRLSLRSLLAAACVLTGCRTARETATAPVRADCGPTIAGMEAVLKPSAFVVLGEIHGTQEAPAFAARLACHAAALGQPVRLALELPVEEQARIDTFVEGEAGTAGMPTDSAFWNRAVQDGRGSEAMRQLLERVRELRHAGLSVRVVAFDPGGSDRDTTMADQLRQARSQARGDTFIVLVGNLHARRDMGAPWDSKLRFMTHQLLDAEPGLVSLDLANAGGSAWICRGMTPDTCGPQPLRGPAEEQPLGITLQKSADDPDGYDGTYSVGALHASPPAHGAASTATPAPN
ncbi:ChaN family lipoprotein [Corallococcus sp. Z5C101001]|uniref:ChaN family lipoprotein n=1 Tax=Corallococcus sp. Z5C101001 TaxID=2596829 RepID=UPI00117EEF20|nr:ChaN family lipoprotein [Corallococcus sp. Z5C101001]TSC33591.1 ChaN family lipoprotein [Corallococcus sp. Z5C101001]